MSIATTKKNLEQLIADSGNRVIALSGKWGTGKSHLWQSVQQDTEQQAVKDALYVSLFGIKDVNQLKIKLVERALSESEDQGKIKQWRSKVMEKALKHGEKIARYLHPKASIAIEEIALFAVPTMLRERFIVLDDIERKHPSLEIGEVMGFIDEYTQTHKARFLLILNSDQLTEKAIWETLREKVIDHEVSLETKAEEAFKIAEKSQPTPYSGMICDAVTVCSITNIRIVQKIIRTVNKLLYGRDDLTAEVQQRVIPSTVLLSGIYYKGIVDAPDNDFVLQFSSAMFYMDKNQRELDHVEDSERNKLEAKWASILNALGISACDEYEVLVLDFLKTGLLNVSDANKIFDRYVAEKDQFTATAKFQDLSEKIIWNPELSNEDLLAEAEALLPQVHLLDAYAVTSHHWSVSQIPGGETMAERLVQQWLAKYREGEPHSFEIDRILKRELHPAIEAEFAANRARVQPLPSLLEVCVNITKNRGWGELDERAMKASTPASYEAEIRRLSGKELRTLMLKSLELYVHKEAHENQFGPAMDNFLAASL